MDRELLESAVALRHELHELAELSGREFKTKKRLMDFLAENTVLELHDMGEWFYALYRAPSPKRRVALRADFDALPIDESAASLPYRSRTAGVSHKCGHDGHSACLAAFALEVSREGCANDVYFIFQNAEETGAGAKNCCGLLTREGIDEIYGFHNMPGFPLGALMVHAGTAAYASTGLIFSFKGRTSHASQPERGRNPAFAIAKLILDIPSIAASEGYAGPALCTIIRVDIGEEAFGTSAGSGKLMLTARAEHDEDLGRLISALRERAEAHAAMYGLELECEFREPFPETVNHPACAEKLRRCARRLDIPIARWDEPFRSSEDFGCYTRLIPGALFYIGGGERHAGLHSEEYDFPDEIIETVCDIYSEIMNQ